MKNTANTMKRKFILILLILGLTATVWAIDVFPSYRGSGRVVYVPVAVENIHYYNGNNEVQSVHPFEAAHRHVLGSGYEPVVSEPGAAAPTAGRRPRRAPSAAGTYDGEIYTDGDGTWYWVNGLGWVKLDDSDVSQGDTNDDRLPIGSPILPFLLMALLACGVIGYRRRKVARA